MKTAVLGLHAETAIHAGAGAAMDVIDLPIQREAHTGWPCIFGSGMKGALRAHARATETDANYIELLFGPETVTDSSAYAGALLVGDARLLLLPVRSLTTHFKWITCPAVLQRLLRDQKRLEWTDCDVNTRFLENLGEPESARAFACTAGEVFLEEYRFDLVKKVEIAFVIELLAQFSKVEKFDEALKKQLLVVSNDDFSYFARHAIPVAPHVVLNSTSKTSDNLWFEETLPPETLFYVCLAAHDARKPKSTREMGNPVAQTGNSDKDSASLSIFDADKVLGAVETMFTHQRYMQAGGNETVGMGWFNVKYLPSSPLTPTAVETEI